MASNVVEICRDLIKIDTRNWGLGEASGEKQAAEYVFNKLTQLGLKPQLVGPDAKRQSVLCEIPGRNRQEKILLHAHLDVVPFDATDWTFDPLAAHVHQDVIYGRGAVDMKNGIAMILATLEDLCSDNFEPENSIMLAFFADEEAGGILGSHWVVDNHRDFFANTKYAIGEVGGFSSTLANGVRMYLIETAQKGIAWMRLNAKGTAGHGSMINSDNAITEVVKAVERIANHKFPLTLHESVKTLLEEGAKAANTKFDPADPEKTAELFGSLAKIIKATLRDTANPTMLSGGYKSNVIPPVASATIDGRFLPGHQDDFLRTIKQLAGEKIDIEFENLDIALSAPFSEDIVQKMKNALAVEDPGALVVPYMLSGGTDAKALAKLQIKGYGFMPLQLPNDLDFAGLFHGVDERIPIESLEFGSRAFKRFVASL